MKIDMDITQTRPNAEEKGEIEIFQNTILDQVLTEINRYFIVL